MGATFDIDLSGDAILEVGEAEEGVEINSRERFPRPVAVVQLQCLILVVANPHVIWIGSECSGSVAHSGMEITARPAHGRGCVKERLSHNEVIIRDDQPYPGVTHPNGVQ